MDPISEKRLGACHPDLSHRVHEMFSALAAQTPSIIFRVDQGIRTFALQQQFYMQSRGGVPSGPKVTNAPGGFSNHNFGMAVDCVPDKIDGAPWSPDWDGNDVHYARMITAGRAAGLVCGADWHSMPDRPHFQLDLTPTTPTDQMRADLAKGGMPLVWANADKGAYKL